MITSILSKNDLTLLIKRSNDTALILKKTAYITKWADSGFCIALGVELSYEKVRIKIFQRSPAKINRA